jgi:hypothetical protein
MADTQKHDRRAKRNIHNYQYTRTYVTIQYGRQATRYIHNYPSTRCHTPHHLTRTSPYNMADTLNMAAERNDTITIPNIPGHTSPYRAVARHATPTITHLHGVTPTNLHVRRNTTWPTHKTTWPPSVLIHSLLPIYTASHAPPPTTYTYVTIQHGRRHVNTTNLHTKNF